MAYSEPNGFKERSDMAHVSGVTLLVEDYDEALSWYCDVLGFAPEIDVPIGDGKRFVRIVSPEGQGAAVVLAQADTAEQKQLVGRQGGQGVLLFLQCEDFDQRYAHMLSKGVTFCEAPRDEPYAKVVIFEDICGNRWDLLQPR